MVKFRNFSVASIIIRSVVRRWAKVDNGWTTMDKYTKCQNRCPKVERTEQLILESHHQEISPLIIASPLTNHTWVRLTLNDILMIVDIIIFINVILDSVNIF